MIYRRSLQAAGFGVLAAAHQAGDALEQGDQGVTEDGDHDQHGHDQAGQDGAEFRRALPPFAGAGKREWYGFEKFLEHGFLQELN
jgi:hypothetical protein